MKTRWTSLVLTALCLAALPAVTALAESHEEAEAPAGPVFRPIEIHACNFNEGLQRIETLKPLLCGWLSPGPWMRFSHQERISHSDCAAMAVRSPWLIEMERVTFWPSILLLPKVARVSSWRGLEMRIPKNERLPSNRVVGWSSLALGAATGLILGLWSFDGPLAVPEWLGGYGDTSRRLARLGHIAFFGLGILNLLLAREFPELGLRAGQRRVASVAMSFGNIFLPLTLFAAAAYRPCKYLMPLPALAVTVAMTLAVWGALRGSNPESSDG